MRKFCVSVAVLASFTSSLLCYAQGVQQTGIIPKEVQPDSSAAILDIPDEITIESAVGNVLFSHKAHMKFGCIACHHQIHAKELDTPHQDYPAAPSNSS